MSFWSLDNLRRVTRGTWLARPRRTSPGAIVGVGTDSRAIEPGRAFVALRGEQFDGHDFLDQAAASGARVMIVEDREAVSGTLIEGYDGLCVLLVANTRHALAELARAYRRTLTDTTVIAVTGSNGKTTTVRLIAAALGAVMSGHASEKSFNNGIGVPLTILGTSPNDRFLVCEVGTNAPGEIEELARIIEPDIAVITNIGRAHIGAFGSRSAIAREKAALISMLRPGGTAVAPSDCRALELHLATAAHVMRYGRGRGADVVLSRVEQHERGIRFGVVGCEIDFALPMLGEHNAMNALAALAVARAVGVSDESAAIGMAQAKLEPMRLERLTIAGVDVINDAYNASPESAAAAVETFAALSRQAARRIVAIGDMLELGAEGAPAHVELGECVLRCFGPGGPGLDMLITVGPMALFVADRVGEGLPDTRLMIHSELDAKQADLVADRLRPGDALLLKGSRKVRLELIVQALERKARIANAKRRGATEPVSTQ